MSVKLCQGASKKQRKPQTAAFGTA